MNDKNYFYEIYMQMKQGIVDRYGNQDRRTNKYNTKNNYYCEKYRDHNKAIWSKYFKTYNALRTHQIKGIHDSINKYDKIEYGYYNEDIRIGYVYNNNHTQIKIDKNVLIINDYTDKYNNLKELFDKIFKYINTRQFTCFSLNNIIDEINTNVLIKNSSLLNQWRNDIIKYVDTKLLENKYELL